MCRGDCLKVISDTGKWNGCRSNCGVSGSGKYYFECTVSCKEAGICRIGWSLKTEKLAVGTSATSYGYGGSGKKSTNHIYESYGEPFSTGDCIGYIFDFVI